MNYQRKALLSLVLATTFLIAPAYAQTTASQPAQNSSSSQADPTAAPDPDMAKVLGALQALGPKPIETLTPSEARRQYGAADAVKKVIKDEDIDAKPHDGLSISNRHFADMGALRLRYYTPDDVERDSSVPVIVYFRGGGWVIADLDAYDATPSALARKAHAIVVSVDYPMAPEHKFPAAHDIAIEAYGYVLKNAKGWGGDPSKVSIVGESAGGNLAVATAIAARDKNMQAPKSVISVYPVATTSMDTPSKKDEANAKPLNTAMMGWFFDKVLNGDQDKKDPRLELVSADLKNLPPVTIINAQIDPLRSDGDMLTDKLKVAGNDVTHKVYGGVTHEFFGMDAVVAKAKEAQDFAVSQLQKGFGASRTTGAAAPK
jgi:acetyl esterase